LSPPFWTPKCCWRYLGPDTVGLGVKREILFSGLNSYKTPHRYSTCIKHSQAQESTHLLYCYSLGVADNYSSVNLETKRLSSHNSSPNPHQQVPGIQGSESVGISVARSLESILITSQAQAFQPCRQKWRRGLGQTTLAGQLGSILRRFHRQDMTLCY
jgi:hypothetical protein